MMFEFWQHHQIKRTLDYKKNSKDNGKIIKLKLFIYLVRVFYSEVNPTCRQASNTFLDLIIFA